MQAGASSDAMEEEAERTEDHHSSKLVLWQGVALLTADCLGVGVLALPHDVNLLGWGIGLGFLISNFPINYFAGNLLAVIALDIERNHDIAGSSNNTLELEMASTPTGELDDDNHSQVHGRKSSKKYTRVAKEDKTIESDEQEAFHDEHEVAVDNHHEDELTKTYDLISISKAVFDNPAITKLVLIIYYTNLFLVLGDYILVMARAVSAMFLDQICIPTAGALASVLMFAICQLKTMANLGRNVSLVSLLAMLIVLLQCLFHHRNGSLPPDPDDDDDDRSIWQKFSALASIGFAVGSQKLFLNIRHELLDREEASQTLAWSLTTYGMAYLVVIILAGANPPSFLFDAIPEGLGRRIAGALLWGHVAVSYAINSQALCSSLERILVQSHPNIVQSPSWQGDSSLRWLVLTFCVALTSYLVSNAVPFFKDLVALIGALTSVPLTLSLPALLHRKTRRLSLFWPHLSPGSFALFAFSLGFLAVGLIGALSSIDEDWLSHGRPFSCR